jgi:hypothetical protein
MKRCYALLVSILLIFLPIKFVQGAERTEYLSAFTWTNFSLTLPNNFNLNWEFETYNSSFQATVRIDDPDGYFQNLITAVTGSGVYTTTKEGKYTITLLNSDSVGGYILFTYNEPAQAIPGSIPLILVGIIGTFAILKSYRFRANRTKKYSYALPRSILP